MKKTVAFISILAIVGTIYGNNLPRVQTVSAQAEMPAIAQPIVVEPTLIPFPDVPADHVNVAAIQYLKDQGIVEGIFDKYRKAPMFRPTFAINRAEFIKIVVGTLTKNPQGVNCFKDVKNEWFAPFACEAKTRGILSGYEDGTFKPMKYITFTEAAKIIAVTFHLEGDKGTEWYQEYVTALEKKNAIPFSITVFSQNIRRADMAEIIYRLKANVQTKLSRTYQELASDDFITMNSCSALLERMKETGKYNPYPSTGGGGFISTASGGSGGSGGLVSTGGGGEIDYAAHSPSYSTTNLQVEGVDEADIIKNDGQYIYMVKDSTVRIIEAYPADKLQEKTLLIFGEEGETYYPKEMYLENNRLTVIGKVLGKVTDKDGKILATPSRTKIYVINVADPLKPTLVRFAEFDGGYLESRTIDNTLYLIMSRSIKDSLPKVLDSVTNKETEMPCDKIFVNPKANGTYFTLVAAIPLSDNSKAINFSAISRTNSKIYVSKNNIYMTSDYPSGTEAGVNTAINRFELGDGTIKYKKRGIVPGRTLNQFSMDEYKDSLRIATTTAERTSKPTNNLYVINLDMEIVGKVENIAPGETIYSARFMGNRAFLVTYKQIDPFFVLDLKDPKNPKLVGALKIPGFSTYLQPYDENHIMGFGKEMEVTETLENPKGGEPITRTVEKGLKVSLFDVTDIGKPKEIFKEVIGDKGTTSDILNNHKALLFDKEKGLLAFPVILYQEQSPTTCSKFTYSTCPISCAKMCMPSECTIENGMKVCKPGCDGANSCVETAPSRYAKNMPEGLYVYVYHLDLENGFQLKGKITHFAEGEISKIINQGYVGGYSYSAVLPKMIQRAFYIGENLYTVSQSIIKASKLSDLAELKSVELMGSDSYYNYYYDNY